MTSTNGIDEYPESSNDASAQKYLDPTNFAPEDVITTDVCVIGGGASGTYTALRLHDHGKSVVLVERNSFLGGHTETYTDPTSGKKLEKGVCVFGGLEETKELFSRFGIPLTIIPPSLGLPDLVYFAQGLSVEAPNPDTDAIEAAFERYAGELSQYPEIWTGFDLKYPVADDLLLPFGDFVTKHSLEPIAPIAFAICQGFAPLMEISTLYVLKILGFELLSNLTNGFLAPERQDSSELYEKMAGVLGSCVLLSSNIVAMDRSSTIRPAKVLVQTATGKKLILAKKIVSTIPPLLDNLRGFDLSETETSLFSQFYHSAYYNAIVRGTQLPAPKPIQAFNPTQPFALPELPGIYTIHTHSNSDLVQVYYGSPHTLKEEDVRTRILADVQRLQKSRGIAASPPEIVAFANHAPVNMMVSKDAIADGFYERLYALQGKRHTFYNGAAFHTQDSAQLWRFTERLLPAILQSLE